MARAKVTASGKARPAARKKEAEVNVTLGPRTIGALNTNSFYSQRYGAQLDLHAISRAIRAADTGNPASLHDILNELRQKCGDLHSVLQTRELALLGKGWSIRAYKAPGARKATRRAEKVAAHVRWALLGTRKLRRSIAHLLDGMFKGYSVCETEWEVRKGHVVPKELHCIPGRRWGFLADERLVFTDAGLASPGHDFIGELPHRFVVHQPRVNGDIAPREGLGRVLVWLAAFSNKGWRDWMMLSDMYGRPERLITLLKELADNDDKIAAQEIADAGVTSGSTLVTDAIKVETRWPDVKGSGSQTPQKALINESKDAMALVTLGQLGTTSDVKNGLGATGGNQEKVLKGIVDADNDAISETITDQLIRWIVCFAFGPDEPLPTFAFDVEEATDAKALAEALNIYVDLGLEVPKAYVHDVTGIPAPAPGDPILAKATPAPPKGEDGAPGEEDSDEDEEPKEKPEDDEDEDGDEAETAREVAKLLHLVTSLLKRIDDRKRTRRRTKAGAGASP